MLGFHNRGHSREKSLKNKFCFYSGWSASVLFCFFLNLRIAFEYIKKFPESVIHKVNTNVKNKVKIMEKGKNHYFVLE